LSDFREGRTGTFDPKTDDTDTSLAPIKEVAAALKLNDDKLMDGLSQLVDLDNFATFWALNVLIGNLDSYFTKGNNFFIYFEPSAGGKMHFIPWGVDATFRGSINVDDEGRVYVAGLSSNPIFARRLYNLLTGQEKFIAAMSSLLNEVWNEAVLLDEIDRIEKLIGAFAIKYSYKGDFVASVVALRDFVTSRRPEMQRIVDNPLILDQRKRARKPLLQQRGR